MTFNFSKFRETATIRTKDYRNYILEHDTFLKRPVVIIEGQIFIGSGKKNIEALRAALSK